MILCIYIYIYMFVQSEYFRIILSILELNPFGVVEQKWKMSKHFILYTFGLPVWIPESWTMLNQKVGPGHYICHYMSLRIFVPEMKHDGNYCRYHPVKVKWCKKLKRMVPRSRVYISHIKVLLERKSICRTLKYREMVISTLSKAKWYWCQYNDTGAYWRYI